MGTPIVRVRGHRTQFAPGSTRFAFGGPTRLSGSPNLASRGGIFEHAARAPNSRTTDRGSSGPGGRSHVCRRGQRVSGRGRTARVKRSDDGRGAPIFSSSPSSFSRRSSPFSPTNRPPKGGRPWLSGLIGSASEPSRWVISPSRSSSRRADRLQQSNTRAYSEYSLESERVSALRDRWLLALVAVQDMMVDDTRCRRPAAHLEQRSLSTSWVPCAEGGGRAAPDYLKLLRWSAVPERSRLNDLTTESGRSAFESMGRSTGRALSVNDDNSWRAEPHDRPDSLRRRI